MLAGSARPHQGRDHDARKGARQGEEVTMTRRSARKRIPLARQMVYDDMRGQFEAMGAGGQYNRYQKDSPSSSSTSMASARPHGFWRFPAGRCNDGVAANRSAFAGARPGSIHGRPDDARNAPSGHGEATDELSTTPKCRHFKREIRAVERNSRQARSESQESSRWPFAGVYSISR